MVFSIALEEQRKSQKIDSVIDSKDRLNNSVERNLRPAVVTSTRAEENREDALSSRISSEE